MSYDWLIGVLTIISLLGALGIVWPGQPASETVLLWNDYLICLIFCADFVIILRRAPSKMSYFVRSGGWLDLLGAVPIVPSMAWTAVFRLARINRLVRIIRHDKYDPLPKAQESQARLTLQVVILIAIVLLTVSSLLILRFERTAPDATITTGATAFWWAFVTMTTVGYGDFVPVTNRGRILAIGLMTFGIGIFAVLTSFLASKFVTQPDDQTDLMTQILEENAAIRTELGELKKIIKQKEEGHR